ncbi:PAS domain S-box protein [Marichromatium bheemlicum]|uniref:histidine kinase n=1 Tax=Marichromatium bheemlicum TaxID=365339 RepID=A0ABX1I7M8_9GAMM|nr:PAS domain S-box protein [Marichromatium bheemlicum]NKN33577.1 PAS domain S-box protein [Marichromatium bheemlicum]
MSFRLKTILGIALIETILLVILIVSGLGFLRSSNEAQLAQRAFTLTQFFAATIKDAVITTDLATIESALQEILDTPEVVYVRVYGQGMVLAEGGAPSALEHATPDHHQLQADDPVFDARAEIRVGTQPIGQVEMGFSTEHILEVLASAQRWSSAIAAIEVVLVAIFSFVLGTILTRRLQRLHDGAEEVTRRGPGVQIPVQGRDEVARLTRSFNRMSGRLAETYEQLSAALQDSRELARATTQGEAKNAATLAASLDAIVTVDADGRIIEFNGHAEHIFGYAAREAIGASMSELLIPPAYRAAHEQGMERYLASGVGRVINRRIELSALHKDGHTFPIELNIAPIETEDDLIFTSFIRDITDRQRVEQELKLAAQALEADEAIFITNRDGEILRINEAFTRITGYSEAEVLGRNPRILSSGRHDRAFYQAMWASIAQRGGWRGELYNRRKDGTIYPESLSITAVKDAAGATTNYVAHFVDITERRRNEESLKTARRQAEAASEAKSRFLATMSHEIRTPLNSIINMNNLLLESDLDAEQRQFATAAVNGGQLLLALLNNVLDFSKIEAGKLTLERQWFRAIDIVNTVASLFSAEAQGKGIEVVVVAASGIPSEYHGDILRTKQVLTNLVGNAIKFTDSGGIRIGLDYRRSTDASRGTLLLEVEDTGIGISEAQQRTLFEEFVQADNSPTRRYQGSGLGLTISLRLVELMGGHLECRSREGEGAHFTAAFPVSGRGAHDTDLAEILGHLRHCKVDVFSANPVLLKGIVEQLEHYGIASQSFDQAPDLEAALQRLDPEAASLVLLDTPSGAAQATDVDYVKRLPSRYPLLRFVRLAPMGEVGAIDVSKRLGFRSVVRKPARLYSLLAYLAEALGGVASATLPSTEAVPRPRAPDPQGTRPARILLVEDSASNVAVATAILQKSKHEVVVAWSGEEAIECAEESRFDLILMDISMPLMDGLEATRRIRAGGSPNRETTIIAMTANAFAEDRERCFSAGMNDFLSKPIDIGNLRRMIAKWLSLQPTKRPPSPPEDPGAMPTAPGVKPPVPDLDPRILDQLADNTAPELVPELIGMFLEESAGRVATLIDQQASEDIGRIQTEAHSLKSGAGSFGALRLQRLAQEIEKAAKEKDREALATSLLALPSVAETSFQLLRQACAQWRGKSAAAQGREPSRPLGP